jgi:hypothetical protein
MSKGQRGWKWFGLVAIGGFIVVNGYLWYLSSRIVPFETRLPLGQTGYSETFRFCCLHPTDYVLVLTIDHPERTYATLLKDWEATERELRTAFNVSLAIDLRDKANNALITHKGDLNDWKLTNSPLGVGADGGFWKYRFDARFFERYELRVNVLKGSADAEKFRPTLLLHGVDDGYFWLGVWVLNGLWAVLVVLGAIIGLVIYVFRRRHAT